MLLLYVVAALGVLGVRHVLLPNIEHYKPAIQQQLSGMLNGQVHLGKLRASWHRFNPRLEIEQFVLHGSKGEPVLSVPRVSAVLSWRTLFTGTPQFVYLDASAIDLTIRRDAQGHLALLGQSLATASSQSPSSSSAEGAAVGDQAVRWLAAQPQILLRNSTLRWIDDARNAAPLVLHDVTLNILNRRLDHQFALSARPPAQVGGQVDIRGHFRRLDLERPLALETGQGQLYVHIVDMSPPAWAAWVDWPSTMHADQVDVQAWLAMSRGQPTHITADVRVANAQWQRDDGVHVQNGQGQVHVAGSWPSFKQLVTGKGNADSEQAATVSAVLHGLKIGIGDLYNDPLQVATLGMQGRIQPVPGGASVQLDHLMLENGDIGLSGHAQWTPSSTPGPGWLDARLIVAHAQLDAVHRYMPLVVDDDVRDWLKHGLLAGHVYDAHVSVRGDLARFPFNREGDDGEFLIRGPFRDAIIDYVPDEPNNPAWPRLDDVSGEVVIDRASLRVLADHAAIVTGPGQQVVLRDIDALIANLRHSPVLEVSGHTEGEGTAYMAFLQGSPLDGLLQHAFSEASAGGQWRLPLFLSIPLTRASDTQVRGTIHIDNGRLQIDPTLPAFEQLDGQIVFDEQNVALEGLTARFLGGDVQLSGGAGPGHDALVMTGQLSADALRTLIDAPGMQRFAGEAAYTARLTGVGQSEANPTLSITSDLEGMALDFPAPLAKAAKDRWPLRAVWAYRGQTGRVLEVALRDSMRARLVRHSDAGARYFDSGSVAVGRDTTWDEPGMGLDIAHPVFDGDAWDRVVKEFTSDSGTDTEGEGVFPRVRSMRVQTEQGRLMGMPLTHLTYTIRQTDATEWRADIAATETAGTLTWTEENNVIQGPVQAVFHRLAIGQAGGTDARQRGEDGRDGNPPSTDDTSGDEDTTDTSDHAERFDDDLRIPAINLMVENLRLYGRDVGKLTLVGVNEDRGDTWRLEHITLSSTSAHLEGSGVWRLRGRGRGLHLVADVDVSDLGDYAEQIGFADMLSAGAGTATMEIDWHDLPWSFDVNNVDGDISFEFVKGRLSTLNSKSARLLELLSLQSVRRLARLELNPLELTKEGFPYDLLRGKLRLEHGRVYTDDYRVVGPAGTIVLDGLVFMTTGELDLRAVVIPNIDVSGAAIAAGVAINPVVGIGAFLAQWVLKTPLAAAMTAQYKIDGNWDEPEVEAVETIRGQVDGPEK